VLLLKIVKRISLVIVLICLGYLIFINAYQEYDVISQNRIIDSIFNYDLSDYDGYIYIPRFNIKRLIMRGTDGYTLDQGYVGMYDSSCDISSDCLVILAGHNISNVFSRLHDISIGDSVILGGSVYRRFVVYDKKVVSEDDFSYFYNRSNELMLITCTDYDGYRLFVFLKEVL